MEGKKLSAGLTCDECGFWPMPDPFYELVNKSGEHEAFICTKCADKQIS